MFDLFEKIAEGIGFRIASNFTDKVINFIKEVQKKAGNNEEDNNIATSGYRSKISFAKNII